MAQNGLETREFLVLAITRARYGVLGRFFLIDAGSEAEQKRYPPILAENASCPGKLAKTVFGAGAGAGPVGPQIGPDGPQIRVLAVFWATRGV